MKKSMKDMNAKKIIGDGGISPARPSAGKRQINLIADIHVNIQWNDIDICWQHMLGQKPTVTGSMRASWHQCRE